MSQEVSLPYINYTGPFSRTLNIAEYYGFTIIKPPTVTEDDKKAARKLDPDWCPSGNDMPFIDVPERIALLRELKENGYLDLAPPLLLAYTSRSEPRGERFLKLAVVGTERSIAEILTLHVALTCLQTDSKRSLAIDINSLGNEESIASFIKDLNSFCRKRLAEIPDKCQRLVRTSPFGLFKCDDPEAEFLLDDAPRSLSYLSEDSRNRFRETIEFIDSTEIPYQIRYRLLNSKDIFANTLFNVYQVDKNDYTSREPEDVVAVGRSTPNLHKAAKLKKEVELYSASIKLSKSSGRESYKTVKGETKNYSVALVHVGEAARLLSFKVLEDLRRARQNVFQYLVKDKVSTQLAAAEREGVSHTIIIGQKEALERSVIVREMSTRSQKTVLQENLIDYLRSL